MKARLFTTLGCHLCEDALALLQQLQNEFDLQLEEVEIADSDELMEQYGVRIPVVLCEEATEDLGWPFDLAQLKHYLLQSNSQ